MKLLLLSSAYEPIWVKENFEGVKKILFVPYALADYDEYVAKISEPLNQLGFEIISSHTSQDPVSLLEQVGGVYIGGGNTFRLLNKLYQTNLIKAIPEKIQKGMPYMGSSAGSNVACPTIKTTNDMPIVYPPSFDAMDLIKIQINPHYIDTDPTALRNGETREERLIQFHEENSTPIIGLREGTALKVVNKKIELLGPYPARLFQQNKESVEVQPGSVLSQFL